MSENPKRAYLRVEMDLETFVYAVTGDVPNINISLSLATTLYETVKAQWRAVHAPKTSAVVPASFLPAFRGKPE
jgi:hypothetical protein